MVRLYHLFNYDGHQSYLDYLSAHKTLFLIVFIPEEIKAKMPVRNKRVCSSAWLERTPDKGEVGGSSPPRPTSFRFRSDL